jgi:hypothetical protein
VTATIERPAPQRLGGSRRWLPWAIVGIVSLLRIAPAVGAHPVFNFDSSAYLSGPVGFGGAHPPVGPFFYWMLGEQRQLIIVMQVLIGAACWAALALTAKYLVRDEAVSWFAFAGVLVISMTDLVTHWDVALLSDSLSRSLLALVFTTGLWLVARRRWWNCALFLLVCILWAFTRDTNAYVLAMLGIGVAGFVLFARLDRRALVVAAVLIALGPIVWVQANNSERWEIPFYHVMSERILDDSARTQWFVDHGMPVNAELRSLGGKYAARTERAYLFSPKLAKFRAWASDRGPRTYIEYAATHPAWTLTQPFAGDDQLTPAKLDYYGAHGVATWWPLPLRRLLLDWQRTTVLVSVVLTAIVIGWALRVGARPSRAWVAAFGIVVIAALQWILTWLGDSYEVGRHTVDAVVQAELSLLLLAVIVAQEARRARSAPGELAAAVPDRE